MTLNKAANTAYLSFHYDFTIDELIREIPGRRWKPKEKIWTIPARDDLRPFLKNIFEPYNYYCIYNGVEKTGGPSVTRHPDQSREKKPADRKKNRRAVTIQSHHSRCTSVNSKKLLPPQLRISPFLKIFSIQ